jgi:hypothetical protein
MKRSRSISTIAAVAGVIAGSQDEPLSHGLYLIEESLLEVEGRVYRLSGLGANRRMSPVPVRARRAHEMKGNGIYDDFGADDSAGKGSDETANPG